MRGEEDDGIDIDGDNGTPEEWAKCVKCSFNPLITSSSSGSVGRNLQFFMLPCFHFICSKECLTKCTYSNRSNKDDTNNNGKCPNCLMEFEESQALSRSVNPVHLVHRNGGLEETISLRKPCEGCIRPRTLAQRYCTDCKMVLCGKCIDQHEAMIDTRHHKLVDSSELNDNLPKSALCRIHPKCKIDRYCHSCSKKLCKACVETGDHRVHDVKSLEKREVYVEQLNSLLQSHRTAVLDDIHGTRKKIKGKYKELRNLIPDLNNEFLHIINAINERSQTVENEISRACMLQLTMLQILYIVHTRLTERTVSFLEFQNFFCDAQKTEQNVGTTAAAYQYFSDLSKLLSAKAKASIAEKIDVATVNQESYNLIRNAISDLYSVDCLAVSRSGPNVEEARSYPELQQQDQLPTFGRSGEPSRVGTNVASKGSKIGAVTAIGQEENKHNSVHSRHSSFGASSLISENKTTDHGGSLPQNAADSGDSFEESDEDDDETTAFICESSDSEAEENIQGRIKLEPVDMDDRDFAPSDEDECDQTDVPVIIKKEINFDMLDHGNNSDSDPNNPSPDENVDNDLLLTGNTTNSTRDGENQGCDEVSGDEPSEFILPNINSPGSPLPSDGISDDATASQRCTRSRSVNSPESNTVLDPETGILQTVVRGPLIENSVNGCEAAEPPEFQTRRNTNRSYKNKSVHMCQTQPSPSAIRHGKRNSLDVNASGERKASKRLRCSSDSYAQIPIGNGNKRQ